MLIGTVVEGPTDRLLLEAVIRKLIPGQHVFRYLQPEPTLGETGAGWKGVRRWCRQTWQLKGSSLETFLASVYPPLDLLIIHVDADIAGEHDLQDGDPEPMAGIIQPCPPADQTADRLAQVIGRWLQREKLPPQVVLAIPAQDTENWTFAALFPADPLCGKPEYECTKTGSSRPCYKLTLKQYDKLLHRSGSTIKKPVRTYRAKVGQIVAAWDSVCAICPQALRFKQDIVARLGQAVGVTPPGIE